MILASLFSVLLISIQTPPSLDTLRGMSPEAAGSLVLSGREHGLIEAMGRPMIGGLEPPGSVRLELVERPSTRPGGCVRQRWTASFIHLPGEPESAATLNGVWPVAEVALSIADGCPDQGFVHVNPGLSVEAALTALARLEEVRTGRGLVRLACNDRTGSGLCAGPDLRSKLSRLNPWAVTLDGTVTEVWLGERGGVVTTVRFDPADPRRVRVEREIPAPF